ncbi:unnamed protein product [Blepharisma stoltei]|uniref:Cyclin N-terminal domain-containing protein n=1 Tax=Blepharisma stoltei TaxID=1481888 RepID=A0AAU9I8J4_9CILI|nr:unnamed protein product [Blepharisma stoltei]
MSKSLKPSSEKAQEENIRISPMIIPKVIRVVNCYSSLIETDVLPPPFSLDSDHETLKPKKSYKKKIRVAKDSVEDAYLNSALDFLTSIETAITPENQSSDGSASDYSDHGENSTIVRNAKEKQKSFKHCLSPLDMSRWPQIDLSDAPTTIKNSPLKDSLNQEFREKYPFLDSRLTLCKIVSVRENIIFWLCKNFDIEVCTISIAWTLFQRLLSMNVVSFDYIKLYGGICVLLAYKFNEETHLDIAKEQLRLIIKAVCNIDKNENLQTREIAKWEFKVYSHLSFSLLLDPDEYEGSFNYILGRLHVTAEEYLTESPNLNPRSPII